METTLCIIKPDAVKNGFEDKINEKIVSSGLKIIQSKKTILTEEIASDFYKEHAQKPFFTELVEFIISGEVVVQILEGEDAIKSYRSLMGSTNPEEAQEGTLRKLFAESLSKNAVHGSDSPESAAREIDIMNKIF
ncbi:nucleoside-diphosphate kinase [SAR86 cluster bacterium]|jgi:nucleoside-diphosphate kinase|nr:nucleoside-diphosphate kinase [SAR86 cluster bacterium]MDC3150885.1 nucleoside-diphosphate kinase [SAR86 cluster bacterium]|tara:strand:- start:362 stop:766 length:405 start_codon:yes stop_codon:yes gene_type:complete